MKLNKTEENYLRLLQESRAKASILPMAITLKLGPDLRYTPDFVVIENNEVELHEVKGAFVYEDARAKFLAATAIFPCWKFVWAQWKDRSWHIKIYPKADGRPSA